MTPEALTEIIDDLLWAAEFMVADCAQIRIREHETHGDGRCSHCALLASEIDAARTKLGQVRGKNRMAS